MRGPRGTADGRVEQRIQDRLVEDAVPRQDHAQVEFGPGRLQCMRGLHRARDVVAPLHERRGDVPDAVDAVQQRRIQEAAVPEVVRFDPGIRNVGVGSAPPGANL